MTKLRDTRPALGEERRRRLLAALRRFGSLSVAQAETRLGVSRMTVHRDLDVLAARGLVRKVHGGAVALPDGAAGLPVLGQPFAARAAVRWDAKRAIAGHLAGLLKGARTLVLDGSSTVYALAEELTSPWPAEPFIVTGSVPLFQELAGRQGLCRVALHGGEPHPRTGSLVGPLALASLKEMRFDWAVMSAYGVMPDEGLVYVSNPEETELKRAYLACARRRVLAFDSSKVGVSGPYNLARLSDFDALVTERGVENKVVSS